MSNTTDSDRGRDYMIRVIQHLDSRFNIRFFISPRDFDVIYRWYEKEIPLELVKECMERVVQRRREKSKPVDTFSCFYYEVKKIFDGFKQMRVGAHLGEMREEAATDRWEVFFNAFPDPLFPLRPDLEAHRLAGEDPVSAAAIQEKLVEMFRGDEDLEVKVAVFMGNLAKELRQPRIENRYRLNYLMNRFHIPDLD